MFYNLEIVLCFLHLETYFCMYIMIESWDRLNPCSSNNTFSYVHHLKSAIPALHFRFFPLPNYYSSRQPLFSSKKATEPPTFSGSTGSIQQSRNDNMNSSYLLLPHSINQPIFITQKLAKARNLKVQQPGKGRFSDCWVFFLPYSKAL